ncbi:MAG: outer membrane beta-barrel protein [Gemmatimonadales bacterium]
MRVQTSVVALLAAVLGAAPLAGQADGSPHLVVGGSVSVGSVAERCDGCTGPRLPDFSGFGWQGQVGYAVSSRFRLGVEGTWWTGDHLGVDRRLALVSLIATWYPLGRLTGFFLDGGAGYEDYKEESGPATQKATGVALQAGLGYRLPITRSISAVPFIRGLVSTGVSTAVDGSPTVESLSPSLLRFGLGVQWR